MKFQVKDRVTLRRNKGVKGQIVVVIGDGKYKVLWDNDWMTGDTRYQTVKDIIRAV